MEPSALQRLADLPSSAVADALGGRGVLGTGLRRISGSGRIGGIAVTAACAPDSLRAIFTALDLAAPGSVLCVTAPGAHACLGELLATEVARRKLAAVVIDGRVRDLDVLSAMELSIFARGVTPSAGRSDAPGEAQVNLLMGATWVTPGDWIVADDDGAVAIPAIEGLDCVLSAESIVAREQAALERLRVGQPLADVWKALA